MASGNPAWRTVCGLDRSDAALDRPALETIVGDIHAGREGGLAHPPLTYVELLLL